MFPGATTDDIMYSETQVRTMGSDQQSFCLKWNHHKTNLVEILDALIKVETYVDCTLVVDDQVSFKAHRVVLAANSPYFQSILSNVPMDHCSILFPGVKDFEMRALLEYMYTGEVNVIQAHIPNIMKVAEQLEVKGLFDMSEFRHRPNGEHISGESPPRVVPAVPTNNVSPQAPPPSARLLPPPNVPVLSAAYDSVDMNPLKRKKLSSMLASRDTPILRNVLAQNSPPDPQPVSLVCHSNNQQAPPRLHSNGSSHESERVPSPQRIFDYRQRRLSSRASSPHYNRSDRSEDAHSPYTDRSYEEDSARTFHPSSPPTNFQQDVRSGLATYVPAPQQKPEWKRYKQYTRSDIMSAIECVRNGMSALQASRKYGVPSRTLYDKVKKLGITTSRPMSRGIKRETNGAAFPYGLSGTGGNEDGPSTAPLLDPAFIQHALEGASRDGGREALHAMALAAAAHAALAPRTSPPSLPHSSPSPPHDEDQVEDLSVSRRRDPDPPSGVIVPPRSFALDCSSERD